MNLFASFLFVGFGMTVNSFENEVGKQCYGRGVDDPKALHPFGCLVAPAVR